MSFFNLFRQSGQESTPAAENTNKKPIEEHSEYSQFSENTEHSEGSQSADGTTAAGYAELPGTDADSDTDPVFLHHIRAGFWDTDTEAE